MSNTDASQIITNYVLVNHVPGKSLWHISLSTSDTPDAKNIHFETYEEAKGTYDALVNRPPSDRKFESENDLPIEDKPKIISIWQTSEV